MLLLLPFSRSSSHAVFFALALGGGLRGHYNVVGPGAIPLSILVREAGRKILPFPAPVLPLFRGRFGFPRVSSGALDFLRHPCLVDGSRFAQATGFEPRYDLQATVRSMRDA